MAAEASVCSPRCSAAAAAPARARRTVAPRALLALGGALALASCGAAAAFAGGPGRAPQAQAQARRPGAAGHGPGALPPLRAPPRRSCEAVASPAALLAAGAAAGAVAAQRSRDGSRATMYGKHDRTTFRGKVHRNTFGICRMRPKKKAKLRKIRMGKWDMERAKSNTKPERPHGYDVPRILNNKMYYIPEPVREKLMVQLEEYYEWMRKPEQVERYMGKEGKQWAYENWTPP